MQFFLNPQLRKALQKHQQKFLIGTEVPCANCGIRAWKTMMRKVDGAWVCKGCWDELSEEIMKREIRKELIRKGRFNPSER